MKKKQKCKVCKKGVKQKAGPGRPKTMHDRCKGKKKTTKKKKAKKKTKKAKPSQEEIETASAAWREAENIVEGGNMLAEAEQGWTRHMKARARATQKITDAFKAKYGVDIWTYVWNLEDAKKKTTKKKTKKKKRAIKKPQERCKFCGTAENVLNKACGRCHRDQYGKVTPDSCDKCGGFGLIPECPDCGDIASFRRNPIGGYRPGGAPRQPSEAKTCEICGKTTREGKMYCPEHIASHSYVKELMERLAGKAYEEHIAGTGYTEERVEIIRELHPDWKEEEIKAEAELEKLEKHLEEQQVDTSLTMEEILLILKLHGGRTVERLARDINVNVVTVKAYVALLRKRGLVITGRGKRGNTIVKLPPKKRLRRRNPWMGRSFSRYSPTLYSHWRRNPYPRMPW